MTDRTLELAKQLIATKLSAMPSRCNDSSCVSIEIVRADQLLALYPIGSTAILVDCFAVKVPL